MTSEPQNDGWENLLARELQGFSFFQGVPAEQGALLRKYFSVRQVGASAELWHEGEPGDFLALILSGCMQLKKDTEFGSKPIVVGVFSAGAIIGELSFAKKDVRVLTASALDHCTLAILTRASFDSLVEEHPAVGVQLLETVLRATCKRLEKSYERLASIF